MPKRKTPKTLNAQFKSENVEPQLKKLSVKARFQYCYNLLYNKLTPELKKRVLQAKEDSLAGKTNRDYEVEAFLKSVCSLAESYE